MKTSITKSIVIIIILTIIAVGIHSFAVPYAPNRQHVHPSNVVTNPIPNPDPNQGVMCTMEAKMCPDGSYVGRTGPHCEFSACPTTAKPAAPSTASTSSSAIATGVKGVVMLGPTCPVMRNPPDPGCADKPYETLVTVFRASDAVHAYASTESATDGSFTFTLPPGDYVLGAGESNLPRCDHPAVVVPARSYATTTIQCDTGIR